MHCQFSYVITQNLMPVLLFQASFGHVFFKSALIFVFRRLFCRIFPQNALIFVFWRLFCRIFPQNALKSLEFFEGVLHALFGKELFAMAAAEIHCILNLAGVSGEMQIEIH